MSLLRFTPDELANMNMAQFNLAVEGVLEMKGVSNKKTTRNDLLNLMDLKRKKDGGHP